MHPLEAAFSTHEALARAQCLFATYGHMYPKWQTVYMGTIDIAVDSHNEYCVVDWDLRNEDGHVLDCSPRFYEDSNGFACDQCPISNPDRQPGLYRFQVSYSWTDEEDEDRDENGFTILGGPVKAEFPSEPSPHKRPRKAG